MMSSLADGNGWKDCTDEFSSLAWRGIVDLEKIECLHSCYHCWFEALQINQRILIAVEIAEQ